MKLYPKNIAARNLILKWKKNTTLSEQFQNQISKKQNRYPLIHKNMIWLGTGTSIKHGGVKLVLCFSICQCGFDRTF